MRRAFLVTSLLAGVLAFGSMPASAGVYADVNVRINHRGGVYDSQVPRGDWQSGDWQNCGGYSDGSASGYGSGYGYADDQWSNDRCASNGVRLYRVSGQWDSRGRWGHGHGHGRHWNRSRGDGRWGQDRSDRGWGDSRGYDRNDENDRYGN